MRGDRGVVYVAYGLQAIRAARGSIATLKAHSQMPVVVLSGDADLSIPNVGVIRFPLTGTRMQRSRQAKLRLLERVPTGWKYILYLDADTEVQQGLDAGFKFLKSGWDLAITASAAQGADVFHHVGYSEVVTTTEILQNPFPLQLQAGVMFIRRSQNVESFFKVWYQEWQRFKGQDQAAMLRALDKCPVRICLLGRAYNGGDVVQHFFGRAR